MIFSDPVFGKDFFDREEILQLLQKRTVAFEKGYRQNIALLGGPMVGKTSILYEFLHRWGPAKVNPVYFEIRPESRSSFAERFMSCFLYRAAHGKPQETPRQVSACQEAKSLMDQGQVKRGLTVLLELIDLFVEEKKKPCLMILDEFHLLEQILGSETFSVFGKKILLQKQVMYLFASSAVPQAREILRTKLNLLFGQFEIVPVAPFSVETAEKFLKNRLGEQFSKPYRSFLISVSGGSPFYLDGLTRSLKCPPPADPGRAIVESFKANLWASQGMLFQYFNARLSPLNPVPDSEMFTSDQVKVLLTVAGGGRRLEEITAGGSLSKGAVRQILARFQDKDLVEKRGSFYLIPDSLFRFWLRSVYSVRTFSSGADFADRQQRFEESILQWMSAFLKEESREIHQRLSALLSCFDNQLVEIRDKWVRLPRFEKTVIELNASMPHVLGYLRNQKRWKWIIFPKLVQEEDVVELNGRSASAGEPLVQRKILLALGGIDPNATLLAKEAKLWTWDLSDLNRLMETYDRQKVIV